MQLNDTAIVLSTRKYNDSSIIMKVITENNGIYTGLVRIKKNQGGFGVNITGNKLNLMWRARLSEHLGFFTTELNKSRAHEIMKDQIFLSGINLVCSHLDLYPEREPCQNIYLEFDSLINNFIKNENLPKELKEILGDGDAEFEAIVDPMDILIDYLDPKQDQESRSRVAEMLLESRKKSHERLREQRLNNPNPS